MSKTHGEEDELEEEVGESWASKVSLSDFFQQFEGERREILQRAINASKSKLHALQEDESFYQYMDKYRDEIEENNEVKYYLYQELDKIEKTEALFIREEMKKHGEQELSFDSPDNTIKIDGSCDLKYEISNNLKIIKPEKQISLADAPLSLSLPLQDENGRNMKLKNAKYLFINYDDSGKISHISHPEPIAFEGNKCYCMVEDQKFYLKIEKNELESLKKEIGINRDGELEAPDIAARERSDKIRGVLSEEKGGRDIFHSDAAVMSAMESDKKYGPKLPPGWIVSEEDKNSRPPPPSPPIKYEDIGKLGAEHKAKMNLKEILQSGMVEGKEVVQLTKIHDSHKSGYKGPVKRLKGDGGPTR